MITAGSPGGFDSALTVVVGGLMTRYRSGPTRWNSGWEEDIRPFAELRLYPAVISTSIMSARVRSRPAPVAAITRYRSGAVTPGGAAQ